LQTVPGVMCPGHSVTAVDKGPDGQPLFDSGLHRADGFPYSFRFDAPGTYRYFCVVHGGDNANNPLTAMNGEVVVPGAPVVAPLTPTPAGTGGAAPGTGGVEVQGAALARSGGAGPVGPTVAAALLVLALLLRRRVVDP
jgi:uncharacterized protein (TIGR03382 family)